MRILRWQTCCAVPDKPVVLVVNKVDNFEKYMADVYEFYNLGIGDPVPISACIQDWDSEICWMRLSAHFPRRMQAEEEEDDRPRDRHRR